MGPDTLITEDVAAAINAGVGSKLSVQLTCNTRHGVCRHYGINLATGAVEVGEAVGTIAAQSIGEPGTAYYAYLPHRWGSLNTDITQGLPRIQEIF